MGAGAGATVRRVERLRWERARADTGALREWPRRLVTAVVVGALSWAGLRTFGPNGAGGADQIIGAVIAVVATFALLPLLELAWNYVRAPFRNLRDDVAALSERVTQLGPASLPSGVDPLRVALVAVRSELAGCATRINEALSREKWWSPTGDPLPAAQWQAHFAVLADPVLPNALHEKIEFAYQGCDRLNHRIARYVGDYKRAQIMPMVPASVFQFRDDDAEALREGRKRIDAANTAISEHLDGAHGPQVADD